MLIDPRALVDLVHCRDQLPREIAIQRRLHAAAGNDHYIHRCYADRINFFQRKYRVFNEFCGLEDLEQALAWYLKEWLRRQNLFRWIETHPALKAALEAREESKESKEAISRARKDAWQQFERETITKRGITYPGDDENAPVVAERHPNFEE